MTLLDRLTGLKDHLMNNFHDANRWVDNDHWMGQPCMILVKGYDGYPLANHEVSQAVGYIGDTGALLQILTTFGPDGLLRVLDKAIAVEQEFNLKGIPDEGPEEEPAPTEEEPKEELVLA